MASRKNRSRPGGAFSLAAALLVAVAVAVPGQVSLVSLNCESPSLVAPALIFQEPAGRNGDVTLSLVGWTIGAELRRASGPSTDWLLSLDATPLNAHRSNAVYRAGEVDPDSSFGNSSWQARAGFKRKHAPGWTGEYRLLALYEKVDRDNGRDSPDAWSHPFGGIEIVQSAEHVLALDPILNRWDGWKSSARLQVYSGTRTWWRGSANLGLGKRVDDVFLRAGATLFLGSALDDVSRFLVGGGWELPGVNPLYGYRYGERRVEQGLLTTAGADWNFAGDWEVGARAGLLSERGGRESGEALRLGMQWQGSAFSLGWAVRKSPFASANLRRSVISATWSAALWNPFGRER